MKKTLTIAAAVAALAIGTQAFAAGPTPVAGSSTTAPAAASATTPSTTPSTTVAPAATSAPVASGATSGQPAAAAATAAPASKHAATGSQAPASSKLDAMTCTDYQKRVDDAIAGSKDTAKIEHAKKDRDEGAKLCGSGKHEAGVKHFRTALKDLGVSKTQ